MHNQQKIYRVLQLINLLRAKPPKSIKHIARIIESTERTAYRYIHLLTSVGFAVQKDEHNRIFIATDTERELNFSRDEISLLNELLQTVGKKSHLKESILQKLALNSDVETGSNHLLKAHLSKIIEQLSEAVQRKKRVILRKYQSLSSGSISDRLVEPIRFTDNYQSLVAFEVSTKQNKYFNVERISAVEFTRQQFRFTASHRFSTPDVFGFSEGSVQYEIELVLSLRAAVLLKEEYPMASPFVTAVPSGNSYRFRCRVNDLKPVTRFVIGFLNEIEIVGSEEFRAHLQQHLQQLISGKTGKQKG